MRIYRIISEEYEIYPEKEVIHEVFDVLPQLAENELLKRGVMTDELPLFTDFLWYIIFAKMSAFLFG